ncbi:MAG: flagellar export chaperone FliS [Pirellulaceae bacterium]
MDHDASQVNPYLQQEVLTASPARLRWMLVKRAEELCGLVSNLWDQGQADQAFQWIIRIRDILGELLAGVQDATNPVSGNITDFYVFLLQLLAEIEQEPSSSRMSTLQDLLSIEAETWRLVSEQQTREISPVAGAIPAPVAPMTDYIEGGFSLEI